MSLKRLAVKVVLNGAKPHRHDAEILRAWKLLRALVHERFCEQQSERLAGRKRSPKARKAIAAGVAIAWADPAKRARMSAQRKAYKRNAEWRENQRIAQRKRYERKRAEIGIPADRLESRIFGA